MKEVVYEQKQEMIAWAEARIEGCKFRDDAKAIGIRSDGEFIGVVVFDNFSPNGCWISVASDGSRRWLTREFILRVFAYPFIQCGYHRVGAFVSVNNAASLAFCEGFGWNREGVLREAGHAGEDLVIYGMLRRECRWLPERFAGKTGRNRLKR
ncbi:RimJ/RimL family protein N-acetyltransferase [Neorhizobium galegae]|uniref:GNAT family N-acetyltransferase n=1 Tax=Neorhizobium galegae TaxID=399 RepID=UPI0027892015|nr:GNAT family protein [Neorhizobium galegae]MDQ0135677.1 RimJ/RimL family protein N-acetyltransferase [Neorhizobium galegae]